MRFTSKRAFLENMEAEHAVFVKALSSIPMSRWREPGVWGDGWTVTDLVAHLTAWERMCMGWHHDGLAGLRPAMPAEGYTWRETPRLNAHIQRTYARRPLARILADFNASYAEILALLRNLSEDDLLARDRLPWTGGNASATYFGANTSSHYRTATKILRRWLRGQRSPPSTKRAGSSRRPT